MSNGPWTDEENDLIVADYFAMLADDITARRYNKAEHVAEERRSEWRLFRLWNLSREPKALAQFYIGVGSERLTFCSRCLANIPRWCRRAAARPELRSTDVSCEADSAFGVVPPPPVAVAE